jgi:hypothetical protein
MSEVDTRPRWRDALMLAVLSAVIIGGLVHYSAALDRDEPAGATASPAATQAPTAEATAQLDGAPPTDPAAPRPSTGGTCWDGRETASLRLCGLPEGARGLAWVFPSFADDRGLCHPARPNDDSYPVVESYECFQRALGQPVTVTYDEVKDPEQVEDWLLARVGPEHRHEIPGAHGGRCIFKDGDTRPARITGMYERFPYVVSIYAASPQAASHAWKMLVRQRPTQTIRGVRNS